MRNTDFLTEYRKTLREWVNTQTPGRDGERLTAFLLRLREAFVLSGARAKIIQNDDAPVLHAVLGNGEKRCVLMGHADTVFESGEAEKFDEENGRFYGAGILDMKSGLFFILKIFEFLKMKFPEDWRIEAIINTDEESGSVKSRNVLKKLLSGALFALVFEGSPEGMVTLKRKSVLRFRILVKGTVAHASGGDPERKSAVYRIGRILQEIYEIPLPENTTMNIGILKAGSATNIVAGSGTIEGEIRSLNKEASEAVFGVLKDISERHFTSAEIMTERPAMSGSEELYALAKEASEKIGHPVSARTAGGGSDGAFASELEIPVLDGMGAEGARAHTRREYVTAESLEKRFEIACETLLRAMNMFDKKIGTE